MDCFEVTERCCKQGSLGNEGIAWIYRWHGRESLHATCDRLMRPLGHTFSLVANHLENASVPFWGYGIKLNMKTFT